MTTGPTMLEDHHMMNGEQAAILQELCSATGHPFEDQMTADSADALIAELSALTADRDADPTT
ncbi:hypothetical protein SAMN04488003_101293 [Loktanella fryxellensis]|uniref:Uncharacterized protein n=1 Tax=Loktanella fryxellensis TaxID=245187 RepID=A0A1H7YRZ8_9RHOB|nr:hypothetical protein [Loktanella fryxellensis]SEM49022.1 hypothetical protein SAMN04488003_101293 [Loktanella fryxellensis]